MVDSLKALDPIGRLEKRTYGQLFVSASQRRNILNRLGNTMYIVLLVLIAVAGACLGAGHSAFAQMPAPLDEAQFKASGHKPIGGARLKEMMLGNTGYVIRLKEFQGRPVGTSNVHYWRSDSTLVFLSTDRLSGKRVTTQLRWWIKGNNYCVVGHDFGPGHNGSEVWNCRTLYDLGGVIYACQDGDCSRLVRIVPGNPENL